MNCMTVSLSAIVLTAGALIPLGAPAQDEPRRLDDVRKFENVELKKKPTTTRLNFPQPNLRPSKIHFQTGLPSFDDIRNNSIEALVDVQNPGQADSPQAEVLLSIAIINPHTGQKRGPSTVLRKSVPAITAGGSGTFYIGDLQLPDLNQDWDLGMEATVDPARQVAESDEHDNGYYYKCRIIGRNTAGTLPPGTPAC